MTEKCKHCFNKCFLKECACGCGYIITDRDKKSRVNRFVYTHNANRRGKRLTTFSNYDRSILKKGRELPCPTCGKMLYRSLSCIDGNRRYCSRTCYDVDHNIVKICHVCKHLFQVPKGIADRFTRCSRMCGTIERRYTFLCRGCGKFSTSQEKRWEQKFCSLSCVRRTKHETTPEIMVKQILGKLGVRFIQEFKLGRYSIDFAIPDKKIAIEVDGEYWHRNKERDMRKNEYIISQQGWSLIRLSESEVYRMSKEDQLSIKSSSCLVSKSILQRQFSWESIIGVKT